MSKGFFGHELGFGTSVSVQNESALGSSIGQTLPTQVLYNINFCIWFTFICLIKAGGHIVSNL